MKNHNKPSFSYYKLFQLAKRNQLFQIPIPQWRECIFNNFSMGLFTKIKKTPVEQKDMGSKLLANMDAMS